MKSYLLQYFKPSPQSEFRTRPDVIKRPGGKLLDLINGGANKERGWEKWALPLGCGWFGAKIFGGVPTERIQITENSLANPSPEGLNNFCEFFLDFDGQKEYSQYRRDLSLNDAVASVEYTVDGARFRRELFTSYPDRVAVLRLTSDKPNALSFKLFAEIPFVKDFGSKVGDGHGKSGKVECLPDRILLTGKMEFYEIHYEGQLRWQAVGGTVACTPDGIQFHDATEVVIYFTCATNYRLESRVFLEPDPKKKLAPYPMPHETVEKTLADAMAQGYDALKERHLADYHALFNRASEGCSSRMWRQTS